MQPFNLTRLNMFSPYPVWQNNNESYTFRTDFGIIFRVIFTKNQNIWQNEEACEFGLFNENRLASPNDPKVKATIQCIIEEFFLTNPNILLYQCETGDNRQAMRARLFKRWFNDYVFAERYYIKVSVLRDDEIDNYIALIVQKSNPKLESIIQDFDEFIGFLGVKPE